MMHENKSSQFDAKILRPENPENDGTWAFVVIPKGVSAMLSRRGRITVSGTLNGQGFQALLEPDGQKSHWLGIDKKLLKKSGVDFGEVGHFVIAALAQEPEPEIPDDLVDALEASAKADATWKGTTAIARLDWIHWITSAKQAKTRAKRIEDACDMLACGKKRVCCFDSSGFYSKAFGAPRAVV